MIAKPATDEKRALLILILILLVTAGMLIMAMPRRAEACGFQKWYMPEGYTGGNFDTYILFQNPNSWDAEATVRFMTETSVTDPLEVELEANSRKTLKVDDQPGLSDASVSTLVEASSGVVVERAMYFSYEGKRAGGSDSIGATSTSRTWYLAEGYTGGEFDTYVLVMNPNEVPVDVKVQFITPKIDGSGRDANPHDPDPKPDPDPVPDPVVTPDYTEVEYTVDPMRRLTVHVDEIEGLEDTEVSVVVRAVASGSGGEEAPGIVAERAVYFDYMGIDGGHCSIGAPAPANTWYLPEGRTCGDYDTYVLVMNPNATPASFKASFMIPAGQVEREANPHDPDPTPDPDPDPTPDPDPAPTDEEANTVVVREYELDPYERFTIPVDQIEDLSDTDVATMIESQPASDGSGSGGNVNPLVVERAVYFTSGNDGDGHNTMGATVKHEYWMLAEGYTAGNFDTWVLIQNPNDYAVDVRAEFMTPDAEPIVREYEVAEKSRKTILVDEIEGLESAEVSTRLQVQRPEDYEAACGYGIIAERAMYFEYNGIMGGHCSMGVGE